MGVSLTGDEGDMPPKGGVKRDEGFLFPIIRGLRSENQLLLMIGANPIDGANCHWLDGPWCRGELEADGGVVKGDGLKTGGGNGSMHQLPGWKFLLLSVFVSQLSTLSQLNADRRQLVHHLPQAGDAPSLPADHRAEALGHLCHHP